jgi:hypothetical protein
VTAQHRTAAGARGVVIALALVAGLALVGCGSSKPAYCDNVSKLKASVSNFSVSGGVSGVKTQLTQIADQAKSAVASAKGDFPDETSAMDTAISRLKADLTTIASSPSTSQLATLATDVKGVVSAVDSFVSATKSKCS